MELFESIGARLRQERERIGLSQTEFAAIADRAGVAGATRQSQSLYEKGKRMPDAGYLAVVAAAGVDVGYVLTGQRSNSPLTANLTETPNPVTNERGDDGPPLVDQAPTAGQIPAMPVLTRRERYLLANYRGSDEEGRRAMEATASALAHRDSAKKNGQDGE
ncbi:helix-turn-helix domain-containing protein [Pseudomonas aeruginosa]|jgi:transcriptional regulator with XRE-family HTH domain|uniref:helix-turn-helix domain-containing protein n=1 Tax=Pseudomonas aeruginosa TaxID=287 RepID=UPI003CC6D535